MPLAAIDYAPKPRQFVRNSSVCAYITGNFACYKEKDGNIIKFVSKSAAALITDINYGKL